MSRAPLTRTPTRSGLRPPVLRRPPSIVRPRPTTTGTKAPPIPSSTWTGCITDRTQSYDETGDAPTTGNRRDAVPGQPVLREQHGLLHVQRSTPLEPIIPMTYNWSTLKTAVNAMQPTGGTDQSVGLAWAWQSLLQTGPIPAPAEDPEHNLQQGHHHPVRRSQHRGPLAGLRQRQHAEYHQWRRRYRHPAGAAVHQSSKRQAMPAASRCTRSTPSRSTPARRPIRPRQCCNTAPVPTAAGSQQVLHADELEPDRHDLQHDRNRAEPAPRRAIIQGDAESPIRKSPAATAGLFDFRRDSASDQLRRPG